MIDCVGCALEQRGDASRGNHRHGFLPFLSNTSDETFSQTDIAPKHAGLDGADRIPANDVIRSPERHARQFCGGRVKRFDRKMNACHINVA